MLLDSQWQQQMPLYTMMNVVVFTMCTRATIFVEILNSKFRIEKNANKEKKKKTKTQKKNNDMKPLGMLDHNENKIK